MLLSRKKIASNARRVKRFVVSEAKDDLGSMIALYQALLDGVAMKVVAGEETTMSVTFSVGGVPVDLDSTPTFVIKTASGQTAQGASVSAVASPSTGTYTVDFSMPDSANGWHYAVWSGALSGDPASRTDWFEVVETVEALDIQTAQELQLRRRLNDALTGVTDEGNFFSNEEIHDLLTLNGGSIAGASYDGWTMRAAFLSSSVDISESGSDRRLSQLFKNAMAMADFYKKARDAEAGIKAEAIAGRVVGVVTSLRGEFVDSFGIISSARYRAAQGRTTTTRWFPTHRALSDAPRLDSIP